MILQLEVYARDPQPNQVVYYAGQKSPSGMPPRQNSYLGSSHGCDSFSAFDPNKPQVVCDDDRTGVTATDLNRILNHVHQLRSVR